MDWNSDMSAAPKDGKELLLFADFGDGGTLTFVGWYEERVSRESVFGPFVWHRREASTVARDCVTHWQPLPEPPTTINEKGRGEGCLMRVFELFRQGLDTAEIAKRLRISEAQVYSILHRQRSEALGLPCQIYRRGAVQDVPTRASA